MIDKKKAANRDLAKKISDAIEDCGKSSKTIAAEVGVSPQAITGWKTTGSIGKETLVKLAHAVGKHPLHFIASDDTTLPISDRLNNLTPAARRLIEDIIEAEECGSSSPRIIEALEKVLHVAIPAAATATLHDYEHLRADADRAKQK